VTGPPLIELRGLGRDYPAGEGTISALRDIDLVIAKGEFVAIMGQSGSGKSTLMNVLGCLDRPTAGTYAVAGQPVGDMTPDELASLRREHFGFVFQRYQLLGALSAVGNVEIPAIYAGVPAPARHARARELLERLGLGTRLGHTPGQLSGGQQQRVSIARALMNGGDVILADEPTGALDRASGQEVMAILKELHAQGHTIILVTHDAQVAANADRVIELSDGRVLRDERKVTRAAPAALPARPLHRASLLRDLFARVAEATHMAVRAMTSHRLRTLLTMLGIVIGISSVVTIIALGNGSRQRLQNELSSLGTNTVELFPGEGFGDRRASKVLTMTITDAEALEELDYVDAVTPGYSAGVTLRRGNVDASGSVSGVGDKFFRVHGNKFAEGRAFDADAIRQQSQVAVIDDNARKALFKDGVDPVGQVLLLGNVPVRVIGVLAKDDGLFTGNNETLQVWIPYTTATTRLIGQETLRDINVRVKDSIPMDAAEEGITRLMTQRHGKKDFFVWRTDSIRKQLDSTTATITLLISSIALIALLVGGIGVMNIMLVSVTERTQEIGVRMAVGARQGDILRQFLIEAMLVCLIGGAMGVGLALVAGVVFNSLNVGIHMMFSTLSIVGAFAVSSTIGVLFGFVPARNAARLDPVNALARE
jgi:macrolide transport system ATP-binding/permease protein